MTMFDVCVNMLARKSICDLVMMAKSKDVLPLINELTDQEFKELKDLALLNLTRGCIINDTKE